MQQQQVQPDKLPEINEITGLIHAVISLHAFTVAVFLRRPGTAGDRWANGLFLLFALAYVPLFCLFFPPQEIGPMLYVWYASTGLTILHRLFNDREEYGYYSGRSWLGTDEQAKGRREVLFVAALGILASPSAPVRAWLLIGAVCLLLEVTIERQRNNVFRRAARDARMRQAHYGGLLNG